uniref:CSON003865 protein n=1 Tax=Culicoides sonorensis TaxID=179676 RepID=A0A336L2L0_CULSO
MDLIVVWNSILRILLMLFGICHFVTPNADLNDSVVIPVINCSYVEHEIFYNTRACIFDSIVLLEEEPFKIDTTYEGTFIHHGLFKTIKFINSHINYVPKKFFQVFYNAERFYMNASDVEKVRYDAFEYAINVREIYLDHNRIMLLEDQAFTPAQQTSLIDLSHNLLEFFNKKAFERQTQLRRLYLSYNRIDKLDKDAFHSIPQLSVIKLDYNLITNIEPELFSQNLFIEEIDLSNNKLLTLELHFRSNRVRKLLAYSNYIVKFWIKSHVPTYDVSVNLANNKIAQFCLPQNIEIVILNVENNRFQQDLIEITNITALTTLRELYLGQNKLLKLEAGTFANLINLKYLGLPSTDLKEIYKDAMEPLQNLTVLDISYNPLKTIDLDALSPLVNLRSLYINGDDLSGMDINNVRDYLPNIFEIEISDTQWNCAKLEERIHEMRNKSVYLKANQLRYSNRRDSVNGIPCYVDKNTTNFSNLDRHEKYSNWDFNWFVVGGTILAIILAIILIVKTVKYILVNKRERHNGYLQRQHRDMFTDVQYSD